MEFMEEDKMSEGKFLTFADLKGKLTEKELADLRFRTKSFELNDVSYYPPYQGLIDSAVRSLDMYFRAHGDELPRNLVREWNHVPVEGRFVLEYHGDDAALEGYVEITGIRGDDDRSESLKRPPKDMISGKRDMMKMLKIKSISVGDREISFYADNENTWDGWSIHCRRQAG